MRCEDDGPRENVRAVSAPLIGNPETWICRRAGGCTTVIDKPQNYFLGIENCKSRALSSSYQNNHRQPHVIRPSWLPTRLSGASKSPILYWELRADRLQAIHQPEFLRLQNSVRFRPSPSPSPSTSFLPLKLTIIPRTPNNQKQTNFCRNEYNVYACRTISYALSYAKETNRSDARLLALVSATASRVPWQTADMPPFGPIPRSPTSSISI